MSTAPRLLQAGTVYEITSRIIQGRMLLRPSKATNERIWASLARAQKLYPEIVVHVVFVLANHFHILLSTMRPDLIPKFVGYFKKSVSDRVGELVNWEGPMWARRYTAVAIVDEQAQIERFDYAISQAVKSGLVRRVEEYPGVHNVSALLRGERTQKVRWFNGTRAYRRRRRGSEASDAEFEETLELRYEPLPVWAELSESEFRQRVRERVEQVERQARKRYRRVVGVKRLRRVHPHTMGTPLRRLREKKGAGAPLCHASSVESRRAYEQWYRARREEYRELRARMPVPDVRDRLPVDCYLPSQLVKASK